MFLYHRKIRYVSVVLVVIIAWLFVSLGEDDRPMAWLSYHREQVLFEYQMMAFTVWKLVVVFYIGFIWMYATRWNDCDVHLLSRYSKQQVRWTRLYVHVELTLVFALTLLVIYLTVMSWIPGALTVSEVTRYIMLTIIFVLHYNVLYFVLERSTSSIFGLFVPLGGYLLVTLVGDSFDFSDGVSAWSWLHLLWPDILIVHHQRVLLFGPIMTVSCSIVLAQLAWWLVHKQDALRNL